MYELKVHYVATMARTYLNIPYAKKHLKRVEAK